MYHVPLVADGVISDVQMSQGVPMDFRASFVQHSIAKKIKCVACGL